MRRWVLAALLLSCACKSSEKDNKAPAPSPPTPVAAQIDAAASSDALALRYKVDDEHVEVASMGSDFALLDVKELPPVTEWKSIIVRNIDGREFTGTKPLLLTGTRTMRVVTLPSGAWEFRVMEVVPSEGDAAAKPERIRHKMTDAKSILIYTKSYEPPPEPEQVTTLTLSSGDTNTILDNAALDGIERTPEPGQREARDTWSLASILSATKHNPTGAIRLTDGAGKTVDLSPEELADTTKVHIIKRNRRGRLNYRRWALGEKPTREHNMRGVVSVELR